MRNHYVALLFLLGVSAGVLAQKPRLTAGKNLPSLPVRSEIISLPPIICYYTDQPTYVRPIGPPEFFLRRQRDNARGRVEAAGADIQVNYGNAVPDSIRKAFDLATQIWEAWLISPVPIRINVRWASLGRGTLGSTAPKVYRQINYSGTLKANTFYVLPLAEKLARRDLNATTDSDMDMTFGSDVNWSARLDGTCPSNRQDFVSTAVHEIAHGLGFTDSFSMNGTIGSWGEGYNIPRVFDHYVVNGSGQQLIDRTIFPNPSSALGSQLTSQNVFFDSPLTRQANGGQRAKLYAPRTYSPGSQISHLDEATYPTGSINACMTPFGANGEVVQNPGPIVFGIFRELGWRATSLLHDRVRDSEDLNQAVTFRATIVSDTTLVSGSAQLAYTVNDTAIRTRPTVVPLTRVGTSNDYTATLPASASKRTVRYYLSVKDASGRTFTSPPDAPRFFWTFQQGPDTTPPTIAHDPVTTVLETTDSLRIAAQINDDYEFGIDTAYVEWSINGAAQAAFRLKYNARFDLFQGATALSGRIKGGDRITYRIVARDKSRAKNQSTSPASGFYTVQVVAIQAARDSYSNDFNGATASADFAGNGFSITTPSGFSNPAIHSDHPYQDGNGLPNNERNLVYQLLVPINLKSTTTTIRFDEVVLVEPGEDGSVFGDPEFYDYVVVEGSRDGGKTWQPFADGYDSRDNADWLAAWKSKLDADGNSLAVGTSALYKSREIDMLTSGNFTPGDKLLIRFRLYADQLTHGWGWAIDNLQIQLPKPPPVTALPEPVFDATDVSVYPNPSTTGEFMFDAKFSQQAGRVIVSVLNLAGQRVFTQALDQRRSQVTDRLDLSRLAPGIYFVAVDTDEGRITKRVVIAK
jgi:hypothetical protein